MKQKAATYLCCIIFTLIAVDLTAISPMLIAISKSFSIGTSQTGILFSAQFAGFVIFVFLGGALSDIYGKKTVSVFALAGFTLSLFLFSMAPNFILICIAILFMGGFVGVIESVVTALVSDLNETNTSFYVNLSQVFFGLGALAGPISVGLLLSNGLVWRYFYSSLGVIALLLTVLFTACRIPVRKAESPMRLVDFKRLFSNRKFMLVCLCMVFYTGSEVGGWGWLSTFLKQNLGFTIVQSGIAVAVFWIAMTVGRLLCGVFTLRFNIRSIIICLTLSSSLFTFLAVYASSQAAVWVAIALMGLAYSSQWPLIASFGSKCTNAPSGTVFSILIGSGGVGSMTIPYFMGVLGESFSLKMAMLLPAILLLATGIIFVLLKNNVRSDIGDAI